MLHKNFKQFTNTIKENQTLDILHFEKSCFVEKIKLRRCRHFDEEESSAVPVKLGKNLFKITLAEEKKKISLDDNILIEGNSVKDFFDQLWLEICERTITENQFVHPWYKNVFMEFSSGDKSYRRVSLKICRKMLLICSETTCKESGCMKQVTSIPFELFLPVVHNDRKHIFSIKLSNGDIKFYKLVQKNPFINDWSNWKKIINHLNKKKYSNVSLNPTLKTILEDPINHKIDQRQLEA